MLLLSLTHPQFSPFRICRLDPDTVTLHKFMEGGYEETMRWMYSDLFEKVQSAVTQLHKGVSTKRTRLEERLPTPSDYGKLKDHSKFRSILDHRSTSGSRSGLRVSLQVEAFGHFMDQMNIKDAHIEPANGNTTQTLRKTKYNKIEEAVRRTVPVVGQTM